MEFRGLRKDLSRASQQNLLLARPGHRAGQERGQGDWMEAVNQVTHQAVPDGSGEESSGSGSVLACACARSLHFSQIPGSTAHPFLPRRLQKGQGQRRMDAPVGVYRDPAGKGPPGEAENCRNCHLGACNLDREGAVPAGSGSALQLPQGKAGHSPQGWARSPHSPHLLCWEQSQRPARRLLGPPPHLLTTLALQAAPDAMPLAPSCYRAVN